MGKEKIRDIRKETFTLPMPFSRYRILLFPSAMNLISTAAPGCTISNYFVFCSLFKPFTLTTMKTCLPITYGLALLLLWGCGTNEEEQEAPKNSLEAIQQMADKAQEMQNKEPVDPVDFRQLKDLLPAEAAGLTRKEATGEKSGAMGFVISQAEGRYENSDGSSSVEVEIMDTGGMGGMALMGMAAWTMTEVDKETTTGYERTTRIGNYKAFEKYDNDGKYGELNIIVADRYIVNVKGNNVDMDQMKKSLDNLDMDKLSALK